MIPLTRIRTAEAIPSKYHSKGKQRADKQLLLVWLKKKQNPDKGFAFNEGFWKDAKTQLKQESHHKCAYCEANTAVVAHGDVEHYRPKSKYWWLAYTYDNYLYACQICNQTYKGDHFTIGGIEMPEPAIPPALTEAHVANYIGHLSPDPLDAAGQVSVQTFEAAHYAEKAHLLNPYLDNPVTYFAYSADDVLKEVKLVPTQKKYTDVVKAAEEFYGINRPELLSARYQVFRSFRVIKRSLSRLTPADPDWQDTHDTYKGYLANDHLFAGMCRYFDGKI
jgi:hypothetical protein